jgi:hypothetical protein
MSGTTHFLIGFMNGIFTVTNGIATIEDGILTCESANADLIRSNTSPIAKLYIESSVTDITIGNSTSYQRIGDIIIQGSTISGIAGSYNSQRRSRQIIQRLI